jgi:hypothetical protein
MTTTTDLEAMKAMLGRTAIKWEEVDPSTLSKADCSPLASSGTVLCIDGGHGFQTMLLFRDDGSLHEAHAYMQIGPYSP